MRIAGSILLALSGVAGSIYGAYLLHSAASGFVQAVEGVEAATTDAEVIGAIGGAVTGLIMVGGAGIMVLCTGVLMIGMATLSAQLASLQGVMRPKPKKRRHPQEVAAMLTREAYLAKRRREGGDWTSAPGMVKGVDFASGPDMVRGIAVPDDVRAEIAAEFSRPQSQETIESIKSSYPQTRISATTGESPPAVCGKARPLGEPGEFEVCELPREHRGDCIFWPAVAGRASLPRDAALARAGRCGRRGANGVACCQEAGHKGGCDWRPVPDAVRAKKIDDPKDDTGGGAGDWRS